MTCPLIAGGTVAIAGEYRAGTVVVTEEIVRRLSGGTEPVSLFVLAPPPSPDYPPGMTFAEGLKREGYSEGNVGAVQTFFLRSGTAPWTDDQLSALAPLDTVIHLSRERSIARIYPTVNVLTSRSRLLDENLVSEDHATIASQVRQVLSLLWATDRRSETDADTLALDRARKLQYFFTQPFIVAEPYTKRPGVTVSLAEALCTCRGILDGQYDDLPTDAFYFSGGIAEIRANIGRSRPFGPVAP